MVRIGSIVTLGLGLGLLVAACKGESEQLQAAKVGLRESCDAQAGWSRRIHAGCTTCIAMAKAPKCNTCTIKDYVGLCAAEERARLDEGSCEGTVACVFECQRECGCIERCYEGKDACRDKAAKVEACVTRVCEPHCK